MAEFLGLSEDELRLFLDEMTEHLEILEAELLRLERGETDPEQLALIFRAAHTIKGAAATVGLEGMAHLTHAMETLFDRMRSGSLTATPAVVGALLQAVDALRQGLAAISHRQLPAELPAGLLQALGAAAAGEQGPSEALVVRVRLTPECPMPAVRALQVVLALQALGRVQASDPPQAAIEAEQVRDSLTVWLQSSVQAATVRAKLAAIADLAAIAVDAVPEGLAEAAAPAEAPAGPARQGNGGTGAGAAGGGGDDRTIRVDVALLDDLMNLVGELVIDRGRLAGLAQALGLRGGAQDIAEELTRVTGHVARVTGRLQETVLKARMLPVERIFRKFPRMVRDVAQQLGKVVEFRVAGEETELDRSLLEVLSDPLMHLLRNALDHGIESPAERSRAGKPESSTLVLTAAQEESHVVICVRDDGRGIDPDRVRAAAVRKGLLSSERARELSEQEAIDLLFAPGFSTVEQVTDLSGRGVGLDVVRKNIERVGGRVEVESRLGVGTAFRLILPLTLATTQALLVQMASGTLALPLSAVAETLLVPPSDISTIKGRWVARVRGNVVPLLWVEQFMSPGVRPLRVTQPLLAVLVSHKGEKIGLVVDRLLGQQEVVVKGLGEFFGQVKGVSGVTILGDGSLALIVDVGGLVSQLTADSSPRVRGTIALAG